MYEIVVYQKEEIGPAYALVRNHRLIRTTYCPQGINAAFIDGIRREIKFVRAKTQQPDILIRTSDRVDDNARSRTIPLEDNVLATIRDAIKH